MATAERRKIPAVEDYRYGKDGRVDNSDIVQYTNAKDQRARERQIAVESVRIIQERLSACFLQEGVNQFQRCKGLAEEYVKRVNEADAKFGKNTL